MKSTEVENETQCLFICSTHTDVTKSDFAGWWSTVSYEIEFDRKTEEVTVNGSSVNENEMTRLIRELNDVYELAEAFPIVSEALEDLLFKVKMHRPPKSFQ
jgi:hypothetical protein